MLKLGDVERKLLQASDALTIDANGEETLRGLDVSEARFVLEMELSDRPCLDLAELRLYGQLRALHVVAKGMYIASKSADQQSGSASQKR